MRRLLVSAMLAVAFIAMASRADAKVYQMTICGQPHTVITGQDGRVVEVTLRENGREIRLTWKDAAKKKVVARVVREANQADANAPRVWAPAARQISAIRQESPAPQRAGINIFTNATIATTMNIPISVAQRADGEATPKSTVAPQSTENIRTPNSVNAANTLNIPKSMSAKYSRQNITDTINTAPKNISAPYNAGAMNVGNINAPKHIDQNKLLHDRVGVERTERIYQQKCAGCGQVHGWTKMTVTRECSQPQPWRLNRGFVWLPGQGSPPKWLERVGARMNGIDPATGHIREMEIPKGVAVDYDDRGNAAVVIGKYDSVPEGRHLLKKIKERRG